MRPIALRSILATLAAAVLALGGVFAACEKAPADWTVLTLLVHSEPLPQPITTLEVRLRNVVGAPAYAFPGPGDDPKAGTVDVKPLDLAHETYPVAIAHEANKGGQVSALVVGRAEDGTLLATWSGVIDTRQKKGVDVLLTAPRVTCDADGDGAKDCTKKGCCDKGEQSDCQDDPKKPGAAAVGPYGAEACGDGVDNDCDGATDEGCAVGTGDVVGDGDGKGGDVVVDVDVGETAASCAQDCAASTAPPGMVLIPAGTFKMGCVSGDWSCGSDEKPQHGVTLDAFYMDVDLVTAAKYKACVDADKCSAPTACGKYPTYGTAGMEQHPINCVTWFQADAYCKNATVYGGKGALPTEAQWEKAARGGLVDAVYVWGNDAPTCTEGQTNTACFNEVGGAAGSGCGQVSTCWVTFSSANGYGLRDMAGNVWEAVNDWYADSYPSGEATNPTGPASGGGRVFRGGAFYVGASYLRASRRYYAGPSSRDETLGFRCARSHP